MTGILIGYILTKALVSGYHFASLFIGFSVFELTCSCKGLSSRLLVFETVARAEKTQLIYTLKAKETLAKGFELYPTNQSVLVALINIYMESNDDPEKIIAIIHLNQKESLWLLHQLQEL